MTVSCPYDASCITLSDMIADSSRYTNISNLTIHMLPGVHTPNQSKWITLGFVHWVGLYNVYVSFIGHSNHCNEFHCDVVIECEPFDLGIAIDGARQVHFTNLMIKTCGLQVTENLILSEYYNRLGVVNKFQNTRTAVLLIGIEGISMVNVHIAESKGYGLLVFRHTVSTTIHNCSFKSNNWKTKDPAGGNIYILVDCLHIGKCVLSINHSTISYGRAFNTHKASGGVTINFLDAAQSTSVDVSLHNNYFLNNYAYHGANLYISTFPNDYTSYLENTDLPYIIIQSCIFENGRAVKLGGGLYVEVWHAVLLTGGLYSIPHLEKFILIIENSSFVSNYATYGGAIAFKYATLNQSGDYSQTYCENSMENTITNSTYHANKAVVGAGIYHYSIHSTSQCFVTIAFTLDLISTTFTNNTATEMGGAIYISDINYRRFKPVCCGSQVLFQISFCHFEKNLAKSGSAIWQLSKPALTSIPFVILKSTFTHNMGLNNAKTGAVMYLEHITTVLNGTILQQNTVTPLHINQSQIEFHSKNYFIDNTAEHGAAMLLECSPSHFILNNTSTVHISRNKAAAYGGELQSGMDAL